MTIANRVAIIVIAVMFVTAPTLDAEVMSFFEDFSDNSPGPNMSLGPAFNSPTTDFAGDFSIGPDADGNRIYLGTNATGYANAPYRFEATVIMSGKANSGWAGPFFGMGTVSPDADNFGEPANPRLLMQVGTYENSADWGLESRDDGVRVAHETNVTLAVGTHRLRMEWDPATKIAAFDIDEDFGGGAFVSDFGYSLDGSDNGFDDSNSQLLVGGGWSVSFDDISVTVVPEPSAMMLLLFGMLGSCGLVLRQSQRKPS